MVWTGKGQWVVPSCKIWYLRKSHCLSVLQAQTQHNNKVNCLPNLTLFIPSTSEWVATPSESNTGAKRSKVWKGRKTPIKMLTFRQLTLQCCHHSLTQYHSPPPQFIQNQAPIHHRSHQLYACCHHPWKVSTHFFRKLIFLWLHIIFLPIWMSKQHNRKW